MSEDALTRHAINQIRSHCDYKSALEVILVQLNACVVKISKSSSSASTPTACVSQHALLFQSYECLTMQMWVIFYLQTSWNKNGMHWIPECFQSSDGAVICSDSSRTLFRALKHCGWNWFLNAESPADVVNIPFESVLHHLMSDVH